MKELGEQVVRCQILEGIEPRALRADVDVTIERAYRLAHGQVARGPRAGAAEVAREEPVRRPFAESAQRGQPLLHLGVGEERELVEVDLRAGEPAHILRLAAREAD